MVFPDPAPSSSATDTTDTTDTTATSIKNTTLYIRWRVALKMSARTVTEKKKSAPYLEVIYFDIRL